MDLFETDLISEVFASFSAEKANTSEVAQYHIPSVDEIFFYPRRERKFPRQRTVEFFSFIGIAILVLCIDLSGYAQSEKNRKLSLQVYTGGPSLLKWAFKFSSQYQDKITYVGLPGVGGEINYRINRWVSASADLYYRYGRLEMNVDDLSFYNEISDKWGIQLVGLNPYGSYRLELPRYKGTLNVFVHALKEESPSDLYLSLGFGYNKLKAKLYKEDQELEFTKSIGTISLPVAYRIAAGYAYDFAPMIGLFTEVGIGGPVFSFGVNARF